MPTTLPRRNSIWVNENGGIARAQEIFAILFYGVGVGVGAEYEKLFESLIETVVVEEE